MSNEKITRRINIYLNDKQVKNSLVSVRNELRKLNRNVNDAEHGTKDYYKALKRLKEGKKIMSDMRKEIAPVPGLFQRMTKNAGGFMAMMGVGFGVHQLISGIRNLTNANAELSDAQADVAKTTNLSDAGVAQLTKSLKKMDTRTPLLGLLAIAEEAGRLGKKSVKDIEEFVKRADKIGVALGDDLQGDVAENVKLIGKLVEIYGVGEKEGKSFGEAMNMIGSALNEVAAAGPASATFMVDLMKRMAGVSKTANIASEDIIGFGAVLDEAGQSVEVSGTAMNKVIIDMFSNTEKYASIAEMGVAEFSELLNTDANEAMLKFLEGVGKDNAGLQEMSGHFDQLGVDGVRTVAVIATLAANTDKVREKQDLANKALNEATSLTAEFNRKNNNLAGVLQKIGNHFKNIFANDKIKDGLFDMVQGFGRMTGILKDTWKATEDEISALYTLELQIIDTNTPLKQRNDLLRDFISKYNIKSLAGLNAETISNQQLSAAIKEVNSQLINKIVLQKQDAIIQAKGNEIADIVIKKAALEKKLRAKIVKEAKKLGIDAKLLGNNLADQVSNLKYRILEAETISGKEWTQELGTWYRRKDLVGMKEDIQELEILQNSETKLMGDMLAERAEMAKKYNMPTGDGTTPEGTTPSKPPPIIEEQKKINYKLKKIQEDAVKVAIAAKQKQFEKELILLKTSLNNQYAAIKDLDDAKQYLTKDELKGITNVEEVKEKIKEKFQKQELAMQQAHLKELQEMLERTLGEDIFEMLTEEQTETIKERLREIGFELSKIRAGKTEDSDDTAAPDEKETGSFDPLSVLGYSTEEWEQVFDGLDDVEEKIKAAEMAVNGLMQVWGMYYDYLEANQAAELQKYESGLDDKRKGLKKQLDSGYITEAQYHQKLEKLDEDLEKKKAQLLYDTAKRERQMQIFGAIASTALGVIKAFEAGPYVGAIMAAVITGIGAAQVATIMATPLPPKGYWDGGFTSGMGFDDESGHEVAGVVHANEYVIPEFVMADPSVPAIVQYLEAKRTGQTYEDGGAVEAVSTESTTTTSEEFNFVANLATEINRLNDVLEKGIEAKIFFSNTEAFELKELLKENETIRENARI